MNRLCVVPLLLTMASLPLKAQGAGAIVQRAITAFSLVPVHSVHLTGRAHAIAGSRNESGTFSFDLQATDASTLSLSLTLLTRTDTVDAFSEDPHCTYTDANGVLHQTAVHNCWHPLDWIIPVLGLSDHAQMLNIQQQPAGPGIDQLLISHTVTTARGRAQPLITRLSTMTLKFNQTTELPTAVEFNTHPESDAGVDINIGIRYSNYHSVNGASIPFHIEKYLNNGLILTLDVDNASIQ